MLNVLETFALHRNIDWDHSFIGSTRIQLYWIDPDPALLDQSGSSPIRSIQIQPYLMRRNLIQKRKSTLKPGTEPQVHWIGSQRLQIILYLYCTNIEERVIMINGLFHTTGPSVAKYRKWIKKIIILYSFLVPQLKFPSVWKPLYQ